MTVKAFEVTFYSFLSQILVSTVNQMNLLFYRFLLASVAKYFKYSVRYVKGFP